MFCILLGGIGLWLVFGGPLDRLLGYDDKKKQCGSSEESSGGT